MRRKKKANAVPAVQIVKRTATAAEQSRISVTFDGLIDALLREYLVTMAGPAQVQERELQQQGELDHEQ